VQTLFTGQREREKKRGRERESEIEKERVFILKGMMGALAPFNYIVQK
jgi:hypothetical protein